MAPNATSSILSSVSYCSHMQKSRRETTRTPQHTFHRPLYGRSSLSPTHMQPYINQHLYTAMPRTYTGSGMMFPHWSSRGNSTSINKQHHIRNTYMHNYTKRPSNSIYTAKKRTVSESGANRIDVPKINALTCAELEAHAMSTSKRCAVPLTCAELETLVKDSSSVPQAPIVRARSPSPSPSESSSASGYCSTSTGDEMQSSLDDDCESSSCASSLSSNESGIFEIGSFEKCILDGKTEFDSDSDEICMKTLNICNFTPTSSLSDLSSLEKTLKNLSVSVTFAETNNLKTKSIQDMVSSGKFDNVDKTLTADADSKQAISFDTFMTSVKLPSGELTKSDSKLYTGLPSEFLDEVDAQFHSEASGHGKSNKKNKLSTQKCSSPKPLMECVFSTAMPYVLASAPVAFNLPPPPTAWVGSTDLVTTHVNGRVDVTEHIWQMVGLKTDSPTKQTCLPSQCEAGNENASKQ